MAIAWAVSLGLDIAVYIAFALGIGKGIGSALAAAFFPAVIIINGLANGKGIKGATNPLSVGDFYKGYAAMLLATTLLLDIEVEVTTGHGIKDLF